MRRRVEIHDLSSYALRQLDDWDRMAEGKRKDAARERVTQDVHECLTKLRWTAGRSDGWHHGRLFTPVGPRR